MANFPDDLANLTDPVCSDRYRRLKGEQTHILLLEEAARGLEDVRSGNSRTPAALRKKYRRNARP